MSDIVYCDVCGERGHRRLSRCTPEGWLYGEARDEETGAVAIISVCSQACAVKFWQQGPGDLRSGMQDRAPE
jgi:hypothetical protein